MTALKLLAVAGGGALGACARYGVYQATARLLGPGWAGGFPLATLLVNVIGSLIMGILVEVMALRWSASETVRLLLTVGLLGAFTTFSTFSLDVAVLYRRGEHALTALYIVLSFSLSVAALFAGLWLARRLLGE